MLETLRIGDYSLVVGKNNLYGAQMQGLDLRCLDLRGSDMRDGNFRDANFTGADMRGVDLSGSLLTGADFSFANVVLPPNYRLVGGIAYRTKPWDRAYSWGRSKRPSRWV